jgi:O-antigen ligase
MTNEAIPTVTTHTATTQAAMPQTVQGMAIRGLVDRERLARAADWLAVAVAVSLPWSTTASGILIALWLVALLPTLNLQALRNTLVMPAAALPVALVVLALIGMTWGDADIAERINPIKSILRLLTIPLLFIQFRDSPRGIWVVGGFLVSCGVLLVMSFVFATWPAISLRPDTFPGVPVKDYIIQSSEFLICAVALAHLSISAWRDGRRRLALGLAAFALAFLINIAFVATARSTLVASAVLLAVLAFQRFDWKGVVAVLCAGVILAGLAWLSSPYLRGRVLAVAEEIQQYQTADAPTSSGLRLEFWKKSVQLIAGAPVLGHGTGSVREQFRRMASEGEGASAEVTAQPHNQTLNVAIQIGLVGVAILFGLWISHLMLFRGQDLASWLGSAIVTQNIVLGLFNSYLSEFTLGWVYVFGVGVLGGMVLRRRAGDAAHAAHASSTAECGREGR